MSTSISGPAPIPRREASYVEANATLRWSSACFKKQVSVEGVGATGDVTGSDVTVQTGTSVKGVASCVRSRTVCNKSIDMSELMSVVLTGVAAGVAAGAVAKHHIGCKAGSRFVGSKDGILGGTVVVASPLYLIFSISNHYNFQMSIRNIPLHEPSP
jgi:hypothetical protein